MCNYYSYCIYCLYWKITRFNICKYLSEIVPFLIKSKSMCMYYNYIVLYEKTTQSTTYQ